MSGAEPLHAESDGARCAIHPELVARGVCERCGDYHCAACGDGRHPGVCVRCGARLPSGIPWEDRRHGNWIVRFLLTLRDLVIRPSVAFPGPARVGASLRFTLVSGMGFGLVLTAMVAVVLATNDGVLTTQLRQQGHEEIALTLALGFVVGVLATLLFTALSALSFAMGLFSVGRRRGILRVATRAAAYAQGLFLLALLVPSIGGVAEQLLPRSAALYYGMRIVWMLACVAWPLATGRVCFWAGRGLGLSRPRAYSAAAGPVLLVLPFVLFVFDLQLDGLVDSSFFLRHGGPM